MKRLRGFTLVELMVVIAVIGILTTISVVGYNRYQANSHDAQRVAKATAIAEALEKYYDQNGEYPGCSQLTQAASSVTGTGGVLQGVDQGALVAPEAPSGTTNSLSCTDLTSPNSTDYFAYVGDGSATCATGTSCLKYTLKYIDESNGQVDSITSRRSTNFNTSGTISDLNATLDSTNGFSIVNLTWTAVANATSYTVQYSTDNFNTVIITTPTSPTTNSLSVSSLSNGTTYQFRVRPVSSDGSTNTWSNVATATTLTLSKPTLTAGTADATSIAFSWNSVSLATGYTYQVATDSGFTSILQTTSTTGTTGSATGLSTGVTYYIRVDATAVGGTVDSGPSTTLPMTTVVPVPTGVAVVVNSHTQETVSWNPVTGATSYTVQYSTDSAFGSYTTVAGVTGTSKAITSLQQGTTWYFRVLAYIGATSSLPSSAASGTTGIDGMTSLGIGAARPNATRPYAAGYWIAWINSPASGNWYYAYGQLTSAACPAGAYGVYNFSAQFNSPTTVYSTGATTATTWYMAQPLSGYKIKFGVQGYCQGPSTNSGWSGWVYDCAANPGSEVACTF